MPKLQKDARGAAAGEISLGRGVRGVLARLSKSADARRASPNQGFGAGFEASHGS